MTDLTQIPVPNEGPIADKGTEIYERSFPPEEQVPLPELALSATLGATRSISLPGSTPPSLRARTGLATWSP